MTETPLDQAHAAMEANPLDDATRMRFYERLADNELFLLLEKEAEGDQISPMILEPETGPCVLVFDREERLADFVEGEAPYAALSGRGLVSMLVGQGIGLGLNLGVAPSSILIPAQAVDWLESSLRDGPEADEDTPVELRHPAGLPEALLVALDSKFATMAGAVKLAYLAGVTYESGRRGHMLAFVDAPTPAQDALAKAANEALIFSGIEAGALDVLFVAASDPFAAKLAANGLKLEMPEPPKEEYTPKAPGMDPDSPPILK